MHALDVVHLLLVEDAHVTAPAHTQACSLSPCRL
jgi:hypothetical protein